ncbi:MAG: hypothetical protein KatS3mg031_0015 [Chitinophagales bacterium]|nr:MAG: hypothetical protein KatS3mg031_0015 [Chitinophagales bacterium]
MLLNCHSCYSLQYGILTPVQLLGQLRQQGYCCAALTDINTTSACTEWIRIAPTYNIKPVVGIDFRNGMRQQYIGIARNNTGLRELNTYLSCYLHQHLPPPDYPPAFSDAFIIFPLGKTDYASLRENEFVGIRPGELKSLPFSEWIHHQNKLVLLQPVTFLSGDDFSTHRLLRAINNNMLLSKLPAEELASPDEFLIPQKELHALCKDYPQILRNTERLLSECTVQFEFGTSKNKRCFLHSPQADRNYLRTLAEEGLSYRYEQPDNTILTRMEKELQVIYHLDYCSYFLINWDLVQYARHKGYYYVGRGSGANSLVAYLLRITDVDPIELDLYFERFLNPARRQPPDFDIDFSWTDRDDVVGYLFRTYSPRHVALVGAYNTFQADSAIRETALAFGLPDDEITHLQHAATHTGSCTDYLGRTILQYAQRIHKLPAYLSVHASGVLISEEPVSTYTATFLPPKNFPTTQFSMLEAEDIGLYKFDILSQRGLGKIKDALTLIRNNRGVDIDIHDLKRFKQDEQIKTLLRSGKTIGCFYVESPAMRMLLAKLRVDDYPGLVAASSVIRPGVAKSGMMREYILRFRDPKKREEAQARLPALYELLEETFGVMVYQEDVIKVAHLFAGLSLAEADLLRRGMSWKFKERNEFSKVKASFFRNCLAKGYDANTVSEIWQQIETFASYAFAKGHSASYAVESYQALYLKAHYPLEYMVATLNNGGGFYQPELYLHEARLHGAQVELPCVNHSEPLTTICGSTIWLGLQRIRMLETSIINSIVSARKAHGAFLSLYDFVHRVEISLQQLRLLIRAGAFRFTGIQKKELLWEAHFLLAHTTPKPRQKKLFDTEVKEFRLPALTHYNYEDVFDEIELLGFAVSASPFQLLQGPLPSLLKAADLANHIGERVSIVGYLIHIKTTLTCKGEKMQFGTFLDREGQWLDTVHFPDVVKRFPFQGPGCYLITGTVTCEFGFISIEAFSIERLPTVPGEYPLEKTPGRWGCGFSSGQVTAQPSATETLQNFSAP